MGKEPRTTSRTLGSTEDLLGVFAGVLELAPFSMAISCAIEAEKGFFKVARRVHMLLAWPTRGSEVLGLKENSVTDSVDANARATGQTHQLTTLNSTRPIHIRNLICWLSVQFESYV